ncbi:helix-turn-helix domain-containing protein [Stenotrophomonas maltophilia]
MPFRRDCLTWRIAPYTSFETQRLSLERLAKRELGMGFGEWRSRLRFLRAIDALGSDRSITQIADDLGYANTTSFSEMFKRHSGRTPDQYRRGLSPLQREVEPSSR